MRNLLFLCIVGCAIGLQLSCKCHLVDCDENGDFIKLKLMKDGQNALFGANAFVDRDSIRFLSLDNIGFDENVAFNDGTQTVDLFLYDAHDFILKIGNLRTDTLRGNTIVTSAGDCGCASFQLSKVTINGQTICQDGCQEIFEIQL